MHNKISFSSFLHFSIFLKNILYLMLAQAYWMKLLPHYSKRCSGKASVAKPHHYAAPAPGKNFDATPAAPAPTLLYCKAKFIKLIKV
jgi:hypothetical protein